MATFADDCIPVTETGCLLVNKVPERNGYVKVRWNGVKESAHRASWRIHFGAIPDGMCVCHKCDTRMCANPNHLFLGTHRDNVLDMISKRRANPPKGQQHWYCKFSDATVAEIRQAFLNGEGNYCSLSRKYGMTREYARRLINFRSREVPTETPTVGVN